MERTGKKTGRLNLIGRDSSALALRSFLAFLQGIFKDGYFGFKWQEDRNLTDIVIKEGSLDGTIDPDDVTKLPAVLVYEGPAQWGNMNAAAIALLDISSGRKQIKSPETFSLIAQIVSDDTDEMKDITSVIFTMIPTFPSLIGQRTGIAFPGSPVKSYQTVQARSGDVYPTGIIVMPAAVMVGLDVSTEKGSLFDSLLESVTMTIRSALPELETPRTPRLKLAYEPKDMVDLVVFGERDGTLLVEDPAGGAIAGTGYLEQETELEEDR